MIHTDYHEGAEGARLAAFGIPSWRRRCRTDRSPTNSTDSNTSWWAPGTRSGRSRRRS